MKRLFLSLIAVGFPFAVGFAQDDDIYFVPSRTADTPQTRSEYTPQTVVTEITDENESNWADSRGNGTWDVDEYNRRGRRSDTLETDTRTFSSEEDTTDYYLNEGDAVYTTRIIRFHAPHVGVWVSSPYYADFFYDPFWGDFYPYNYWAWNSWYGWGWHGWGPWGWHAWHGWYDPWYGHWGWGPSWAWRPGPSWGGWYPPHHGSGWVRPDNVRTGSMRGYAYNLRRGNRGGGISRPGTGGSGRYARTGTTGSREGYRPSRNYGATRSNGTPNRGISAPNTRRSTPGTTPSRSYNNSGQRGSYSPGSAPQRNSSVGTHPGGTRSGGGFSGGHAGGGRSFGSGGGSRGGRR